ncbi:MAG: radical SAM protein [Candidatus Omnitrophota bacterium]
MTLKRESIITVAIDRCNMKCRYCYLGGKIHNASSASSSGINDNIRQIILDAKPQNVKFYGGEPLIEKDFFYEVTNEIRKVNRDTVIWLSTNGTLLNREDIEYISENNVKIIFSMDGDSNVLNKNRIFPDGSMAFDRLRDKLSLAISLLKDKNKLDLLYVSFVAMPESNLKNVYSWLYNKGIKNVKANMLCKYLNDKERDGLIARVDGVLRFAYACRDSEISKIIENDLLGEFNAFYNNFRKEEPNCSKEGPLNIVLGLDGKYYFCGIVQFDESYEVGNIQDGIDKRKIESIIFNSMEHCGSFCADCGIQKYCLGGCPQRLRIYSDNFKEKDNFYCAYMKLSLLWSVKFRENKINSSA